MNIFITFFFFLVFDHRIINSPLFCFFWGVEHFFRVNILIRIGQVVIQEGSHMSSVNHLGEFDGAFFLGLFDRNAKVQNPAPPAKYKDLKIKKP